MRRRAWLGLRRLVGVVHDLAGRDPWGDPDPVPEDLDRDRVLVVGGILLAVALYAAVVLLGDVAFAVGTLASVYALRHLAATRLQVLAGWVLTVWLIYTLLQVALWALVLAIHGLLA